jgi:hypothetical protein
MVAGIMLNASARTGPIQRPVLSQAGQEMKIEGFTDAIVDA